MATKMQRGSNKRAALIGAAVLPAVAMIPSLASAMTISATNQGTAFDSFGDTTTGWTGFLITITADAGQVVTAVDLGSTSTSTNGILGAFLQDWTGGKSIAPSPVGVSATDTNGKANGTDSHFLVFNRADSTAPFENNDLVHPTGAPANVPGSDNWGTGSYLRGVFGVTTAAPGQLNVFNLAYVVLKDGTNGTFQMDVAEAIPTQASHSVTLSGTFSSGAPVATNKIVSLTAVSAGTPTTYGNKLTNGTGVDKATFNPNAPVANSINVSGGNGAYTPGFANGVNSGAGENKFFVQATGFSPAADPEIYAYNIKVGAADPSAAQITQIINDINANNLGVVASNVTGVFATLFPGYDILLTATSAANNASGGNEFLAADFSQETNVAGVVVTDVAAVPEPASAAGVLLGAAGLLLGRRKRNA